MGSRRLKHSPDEPLLTIGNIGTYAPLYESRPVWRFGILARAGFRDVGPWALL